MTLKKMTSALCSFALTAGIFIIAPAGDVTAEAAPAQRSIATINITTGEEYKDTPPYEILTPDGIENAWGCTVIENDYVTCTMEYIDPDGVTETITDTTAQIKVRGNTSAVAKKLPYKLKFKNAYSFGTDDKEGGSKKWLLLNSGTDLKFLFSNFTSEYLGSEWQPSFEYVNLSYNGDYKGVYILVESVEQMNKDLDFSKKGFLIENDAYWWAENEGDYFKFDGIDPHVGFTFKEPEAGDLEPDQKAAVIEKMTDAATKIMSDSDTDYLSAVDLDSAVTWFLTKDYLCNDDCAGSNMYWYSPKASSLLKLGPVWDFDRDYYEYYANRWSSIHTENYNFGSYLFEKDSFKAAYRRKFMDTLDLRKALPEYVNNYFNTYGKSLQESWNQDAKRWNKSTLNVAERKNELLLWYDNRQKNIYKATADWIKTDISNATVELSSQSVAYTGRPVMPKLRVTYNDETLVKDRDYTFCVKGHTEPGRAMVTVTGTGKFSGRTKAYYYIVPAQLSFEAIAGFYGRVEMNWNKDPYADGYQIQGSESSTFDKKKEIIINDNSTTTYTVGGLTFGKKYYLRIRSFKIIDGKKVPGVSSQIICVTAM
ncbi:MAG: CotH kinase family protein [Ruminococcus sp.]|nr:CotH kinase family protein [Ruminococcus sp.]